MLLLIIFVAVTITCALILTPYYRSPYGAACYRGCRILYFWGRMG